VERLAERAGVELSAVACWLIVRLHEDADADIAALCHDFDLPTEAGERALRELEAAQLVTPVTSPGDVGSHRSVSPTGLAIAERLVAARRESLAALCAHWEPDENPDLAALLTALAHELVREPDSHDVGAGVPA
jgi:DNA-binding MarR family transcriptional regulator